MHSYIICPLKSCIIVEELLHQDETLNQFSPKSIVDFKFFCFAGKVESALVTYNRSKDGYSIDLYDSNWNEIRKSFDRRRSFTVNSGDCLPKPVCFDKMIEIASNLSKAFPEVRVDFYVVDGRPVIGELTFSTGYGYFSEEYYEYLGELTDITMMKRKK